MYKELYISNLSHGVTDDDLADIFRAYGNAVSRTYLKIGFFL
jgi:RNA recognition motif-containing protein